MYLTLLKLLKERYFNMLLHFKSLKYTVKKIFKNVVITLEIAKSIIPTTVTRINRVDCSVAKNVK